MVSMYKLCEADMTHLGGYAIMGLFQCASAQKVSPERRLLSLPHHVARCTSEFPPCTDHVFEENYCSGPSVRCCSMSPRDCSQYGCVTWQFFAGLQQLLCWLADLLQGALSGGLDCLSYDRVESMSLKRMDSFEQTP